MVVRVQSVPLVAMVVGIAAKMISAVEAAASTHQTARVATVRVSRVQMMCVAPQVPPHVIMATLVATMMTIGQVAATTIAVEMEPGVYVSWASQGATLSTAPSCQVLSPRRMS